MNIKKIRNSILHKAKLIAAKKGWNENLFYEISKVSEYKCEEVKALFPKGYETMIQMYLDEINEIMIKKSQNIKLINLRVHERIRELIILRLKIMINEKKLISKTFLYLLLPNNYKFSIYNLYKTVDEIWFLAGDNSTDFNFYSKRAILASVYVRTMLHFINNESLEATIKILNKQLKHVSQIPKIKNKIFDVVRLIPNLSKFVKIYPLFKQ